MVTLLSVVVLGVGTPTARELDLAGTWQLAESGQPERAVKAEVPGGVYVALLAAGRIPDPYYGQNEKAVQWVPGKNWVFTRTFTLPDVFEDGIRASMRKTGHAKNAKRDSPNGDCAILDLP